MGLGETEKNLHITWNTGRYSLPFTTLVVFRKGAWRRRKSNSHNKEKEETGENQLDNPENKPPSTLRHIPTRCLRAFAESRQLESKGKNAHAATAVEYGSLTGSHFPSRDTTDAHDHLDTHTLDVCHPAQKLSYEVAYSGYFYLSLSISLHPSTIGFVKD
ncbi:hypothetical protein P175DRAFT_0313063 [Aspergillus ochraceoroseus IBT 24754]|uniref:Uncharacterized protein n=1 Tax=Aspergillus ochraceoroseus IBT 24754 TaxID=1392256 RepID=A0A2T5LQB9_9EURO|nr:uncharacterized protein P175DRAFT_0313063 [Aspergillus ochraceoroseus IBT 24754]PTU18469.1 hypothetical protein P175DRAFT_0313063 [Aspergillus ochraceoroseus IBT 24754]